MKKIKINKTSKQSPDLRQEMLDKLKKLYPPFFDNEGMLNQKELEQLVSNFSTPQTEKYEFNWAGKQQSKKKAFTVSKATLRSDKKRSVDFDKTKNLIIEGDNLEVLKLLQKSYFGKIKCIYIDPPYNTGNDFIYSDDYSENKQAYWEKSGVKQNGVKLDTNTDSSGRYHSNWLSMMNSRLLLSRNLLKEDGVIFVSIDDNEIHNLRKVMDEVFGEENFVATFNWINEGNIDNQSKIKRNHEYIILYAENLNEIKAPPIIDPNIPKTSKLFKDAVVNTIVKNGPANPISEVILPKGFPSEMNEGVINPDNNRWPRLNNSIEVKNNKTQNTVKVSSGWSSKSQFQEFINNEFKPIVDIKGQETRFYLSQTGAIYVKKTRQKEQSHVLTVLQNMGSVQQSSRQIAEFGINFPYPKPIKLISYLISLFSQNSDIVLDFFAGSGTTGHAVMDLNKKNGEDRKFILVQIPEATDEKSETYKAGYKTISDICIERVRRAGKKLTEAGKQQKLIGEGKDLDIGFKVFKLATSHFPENTFAPDLDKSDEENKKALEAYIKKATSQKSLFKNGVVDLVYEIALKDGFELTLKMEKVKVFSKNTVYRVTDSHREALVCVDDSLEDATIKQLEGHKDQRFICLHTSVNTTKKWNLQNALGSSLWLV